MLPKDVVVIPPPMELPTHEALVAQGLRDPRKCHAHSTRTKLLCEKWAIAGGVVCPTHGGSNKAVKAKAQDRLMKQADRFAGRLIELSEQDEHLPTAVAATRDGLDRTLGPVRQTTQVAVGVAIHFGTDWQDEVPVQATIEPVEGVIEPDEMVDEEST